MTVSEVVSNPEPEGICRMKASHNLAGVSVTFDEDRLIPNAGATKPALGIRRSSSKVTDTPARLCDAFIRQMPFGSGTTTTQIPSSSQVTGHLSCKQPRAQPPLLGGSRVSPGTARQVVKPLGAA